MPGALPIAGVSAGDNLRFGSPSVENVAWTIAPDGLNAGKISFQNSVYYEGQTGATVWFAFDQTYTTPTTLNVPFVFGGDLPLPSVSAGDQTLFGAATLAKTAKDAFPSGWDSAVLPGARIWAYVEGGGAAVDFPFTLTYTQPAQLNTPFYFGGDPVVTAVTLGDQTRFGVIEKITKPPEINPAGIAPKTIVGTPRAGDQPSVDFLFTVTYDVPTTLNVPFYFGPGLAVSALGSDVSRFGAATATKTALDAFPGGVDSLQMGRPTTYFAGQNGAGRDLVFQSPYFIPPTLNVPFYFSGELNPRPFGWTSSTFSDVAVVDFRVRYTYPVGAASQTQYGGAYVYNDIEFAVALAGQGIYQFAAGTPNVFSAEQYISVYGIIPGEAGGPALSLPPETQIVAGQGLDAALWGEARVESSIRYVTLTTGFSSNGYGTPTTWFYSRPVAPTGVAYAFSWEQIGSPTVWEGTRFVFPLGSEDSRFGTTDARRNEFFVEPPSIVGEFGATDVQYGRRFVGPREFLGAFASGTPKVFNSRQYVTQIFTTENVPYLGGFGPYTWAYNANRTVGAFSWGSSRYSSGAFVYNNARLVAPEGTDTTLWGDPLVADRVRYVGAQGFEELNNFRWIVTYNLSQTVEPSGIPRPYAGVPYVWSNTQWVDLYGSNNLHIRWGDDTFVAPAIRYITFERENGVENFSIGPLSRVGAHYTGLFQQYVTPGYINTSRVGDHVFEERFTIFKPWGQDYSEYGEALVKNNTPQLFPTGPDAPLVPAPMLGFTRTIDYAGKSIVPPWPAFPPWGLVVEFRTKTITPQGLLSLKMPWPDVRLDAPELPVPRTIPVSGIAAPDLDSGHVVRKHPAPEGWVSSRFGTVWVRVQGCKTLWDFPSSEFGLPSLDPPRYVKSASVGGPFSSHGKPRITPHTIYCTYELTLQAQFNNGPNSWSDVDNIEPVRSPDVQWGTAFVTTPSTQIIYHNHNSSYVSDTTIGNLFGGAELVENKIRSIFIDGTKQTRFGFPELPTTSELFIAPWLSEAFGATEVSRGELRPFVITLPAIGFNAGEFGTTFVELFNRELLITGTVMSLFGNNTPMVYHYPRGPKNTGGSDLTLWGAQTVDFAIRYVYPIGYESLDMSYEPMYFNQRLKVYKLNHPTFPAGQDQSQFGGTGVRLAMQIVAPYMIEAPRCLGHDVHVST